MRKTQKKKLEDFLRLLEQAHAEIRNAVENKKTGLALKLLEQCQEGVIRSGNLIEGSEGEGNAAVGVLEEYCELTYRIHEKIAQGERTGGAYEDLQKLLARAKDCIENRIKVRIEAVFLPYKASMWDSLESVWRAAEADPDCDAYVMPIPYYDKNPDGSFREEHYEGDLYPEEVPVQRYDNFDFETHRPDLIFIHNPYDEYNYVTSVHPFFYSRNLKRFTETLIYVPYFVLEDISPDNRRAVEGIEHFCTVPGVRHADRVIVQSEDMRQIYVDVNVGFAGEKTRRAWEEKILGLGSPKMDKALSTGREKLRIPEEWRRKIWRPDGSRRKVVLYNTGVGAILKYDLRMLEKMRAVFEIFRNRQNETALLWRPHPLMKPTIEAMRPQLLGGYQELVRQYRQENWGIYDDTPDMDRAVAVSDGYYGDVSSMICLYQSLSKPVMIQKIL